MIKKSIIYIVNQLYIQYAPMSTSYKGITWGQGNFTDTTFKLQTMDDNPKSLFGI